MAHYLVLAKPKKELMSKLETALYKNIFADIQPFGEVLTQSLKNARVENKGLATWEEEDYCNPPLQAERKQVLNVYFSEIQVKKVEEGEGWKEIDKFPKLFPG